MRRTEIDVGATYAVKMKSARHNVVHDPHPAVVLAKGEIRQAAGCQNSEGNQAG